MSKSHLNPFVASYVKPINVRLTDPALMARCLRRQTENANECVHSTIWARCSKTNFVSRQTLPSTRCIHSFQTIIICLTSRSEGTDFCGSCSWGVQPGKPSYAYLPGTPWNNNQHKDLLGLARDRKRVRKAEEAIEAVARYRREKKNGGSGTGTAKKRKGRRWPFLPKWWFFTYKFTFLYIESKFFFFVTFSGRSWAGLHRKEYPAAEGGTAGDPTRA